MNRSVTVLLHAGLLRIGPFMALLLVAALWSAPATLAQDPPPPPGQGGPPPVPVLLGIADFLITIDHPWDAEGIYHGILAQDPENPAAQEGLRQAKLAQKTTWTLLGHGYSDSHDVELIAFGGGPTFRTPHGNATFWVGTGYYKNDNDPTNTDRNPWWALAQDTWPPPGRGDISVDDDALSKSTINLILQPRYKKFEGYFFLSEVLYDKAPDRLLWNFQASYIPNPGREKYTVKFARHDTFLQNQRAEFFAPESYWAVVSGLTLMEFGASIEYPISNLTRNPILSNIDILPSYTHYEYSDGNPRDIFQTSVYYRLSPRGPAPMPVFRVGVNYVNDNMADFAVFYYAPQGVSVLSLAGEYVNLTRKLKYGVFGAYPIVEDKGSGFATHSIPWVLFGFANYWVSDHIEIWGTAGGINSTGFDLSFIDVVIGTRVRF